MNPFELTEKDSTHEERILKQIEIWEDFAQNHLSKVTLYDVEAVEQFYCGVLSEQSVAELHIKRLEKASERLRRKYESKPKKGISDMMAQYLANEEIACKEGVNKKVAERLGIEYVETKPKGIHKVTSTAIAMYLHLTSKDIHTEDGKAYFKHILKKWDCPTSIKKVTGLLNVWRINKDEIYSFPVSENLTSRKRRVENMRIALNVLAENEEEKSIIGRALAKLESKYKNW